MGALKPIPEIHWRVDRTAKEYNQRIGINVSAFLAARAKTNGKQTLLEIGPGSGANKGERAASRFGKDFKDFALADSVYYPLSSVLEKLIDFQSLEKEVGSLSENDRKDIAEILYKTLVIKDGQTALNQFEYDEHIREQLIDDINSLKELLPTLFDRLQKVEMVPSTISTRTANGEVVYPYKKSGADWTEQTQNAKDILAGKGMDYLNQDWLTRDLHQAIDAFPANVIIGDMTDVSRISRDQVDVELAVRSTVYSRGKDYEKLIHDIFARLTSGGVMLDDSIRDNDGWYYRIAEVKRVFEHRRDAEVLVVLGPGFPGEDHRKNDVPLSLIITRDGTSKQIAQAHLMAGTKIISLKDLALNDVYLRSLDKTGHTLREVEQTRTQRPYAAMA